MTHTQTSDSELWHIHTQDLWATSENLQFKSSELYLLATLREGESESERESSKGHQEVDPVRQRMLFCLWEGTSSRGWETALFLKSSFSANGLSERKTMTERETPNAISPMSYSVTFVSRTGKERKRKRDGKDTFWVGVWTIDRYELWPPERKQQHFHLTHQPSDVLHSVGRHKPPIRSSNSLVLPIAQCWEKVSTPHEKDI